MKYLSRVNIPPPLLHFFKMKIICVKNERRQNIGGLIFLILKKTAEKIADLLEALFE